MKKVIVALVIIVLLIFTGCSPETNNDTSPEKADTTRTNMIYELEFEMPIDINEDEEVKRHNIWVSPFFYAQVKIVSWGSYKGFRKKEVIPA